MKKISLETESIKDELELIYEDIKSENCENVKIYIPIINDELVIKDALAYDALYPVKLDDDKEYLRVSLSDIIIGTDDVENEMDIEYYRNLTHEDEEPYGDDYVELPDYREEYKTIEEKLIADKAVPVILDAINEAIDDYNISKEFENS